MFVAPAMPEFIARKRFAIIPILPGGKPTRSVEKMNAQPGGELLRYLGVYYTISTASHFAVGARFICQPGAAAFARFHH